MPLTNRDWFRCIMFAAISCEVASIFAVLPLCAQERPARLLYFTHSGVIDTTSFQFCGIS
jgi:hypothetical protein